MAVTEQEIIAPLGVIETTATPVAAEPEAQAAPIQGVTYRCPTEGCGKEYDNLKAVRVHQRSHNMVNCQYCGKEMSEPARGPHEKACKRKHEAAAVPEATVEAVVERPKADKPAAKRGRPQGTTKAAMAKRRAKTPKAPAAPPAEVPALVVGKEVLDDGTLDTLIGLLFPSGIPGTLAAFKAMGEWIESTERLLAAAKS